MINVISMSNIRIQGEKSFQVSSGATEESYVTNCNHIKHDNE